MNKAINETKRLQVLNRDYFRFSLADRILIVQGLKRDLEDISKKLNEVLIEDKSAEISALAHHKQDIIKLIRLMENK